MSHDSMSPIDLANCVETRNLRRDYAPRSLIISSGSADIVMNGVGATIANGAALVVRLIPMMSASDTFDCDIAIDAATRCDDDTMQSLTVNGSFRIAFEDIMCLAAIPDNPHIDSVKRVFAELPIVDDCCAWEIDEGVIESEKALEALYDAECMVDAPNVWEVCTGILQVCHGTSSVYPYTIRIVTKTHDDIIEWFIPVTRDDLRRLAQLMLDWRDC